MFQGQRGNLRAEQDAEYLAALRLDIESERRQVLDQFHNLIGDAWRRLEAPAKRIVRLHQQATGRSDPAIRKLFQMSDGELQSLAALANSHLFSANSSCCRNVSDAYVRSMAEPFFVTLDSDIVLCFDQATALRWFHSGPQRLAVATVQVQLGEQDFRNIELPLTIEESELCSQADLMHDALKRSSDSPPAPSRRVRFADSEPTPAEKADEEQMLLEAQMREWAMDISDEF